MGVPRFNSMKGVDTLKKYYIFFLVLLLSFVCAVPCFAAETDDDISILPSDVFPVAEEETDFRGPLMFSTGVISDSGQVYPTYKTLMSMQDNFPTYIVHGSVDITFDSYFIFFHTSKTYEDGSAMIYVVCWDADQHTVRLADDAKYLYCFPAEGGENVYRMYMYYWDYDTSAWVLDAKKGYTGNRSYSYALRNDIYSTIDIDYNVTDTPVAIKKGISEYYLPYLESDEDYKAVSGFRLAKIINFDTFDGLMSEIIALLPLVIPIFLCFVGIRKAIAFLLGTNRTL